jgi:alpha-glucosidase (family GH31 glycosyl hydrolase)
MKLSLLLFAAAAVVAPAPAHAYVTQYEALPYDSVANPKAVVETAGGLARFTVLTSRLIRMEESSKATNNNNTQFEDRPTLAMVSRKLDVPVFTHEFDSDNTTLTIKTDHVTLTYKLGKPFAADTLSVKFMSSPSSSATKTWTFGEANDANLLGTIKSLDQLGPISLNCTENANVTVHNEQLHCEWGVVSRDGWSVYDDSNNYVLGADDWWATSDIHESTNQDSKDLYGFFHGLDYKGAIKDLTAVAGKAAMVPRSASGIWWTRWFDFNDMDARDIVSQYRSRSYPLDVFVLDMDWHRKNSWTGYSFDNNLFPDENQFMASLHDQGLVIAANLHDDVGIGTYENKYTYMANLMGTPNGTTVNFWGCNSTKYAFALEDVVLGSLESSTIGGSLAEGGMDFWWIDWQQGGSEGGCAGAKQNPTIWTNKLRCTDAKRRAQGSSNVVGRNMVLARWGGMGTHRYQVGFSGDVKSLTWENFAYQPYFTLTAANVGYGYWSHDIEQSSSDTEMGTRWVQWAAVSPVFRSHDRGMSGGDCADTLDKSSARSTCSIVKPWNVPQQYEEANRAAMRRRSELTPYIYNAARQAFDMGVGLVYPMYYEHPEAEDAYAATPEGDFSQFYFGPDMFAAPVVVPSTNDTIPTPFEPGLAETTVWVPPGSWVEEATGVTHTGASGTGTRLTKTYDISETPIFVRAGAIIPTIRLLPGDTIGVASRQYTGLEFSIYQGTASGQTRVYEDDGTTSAYTSQGYAFLNASYTINGDTLTFTTKMDTVGSPSDVTVTPKSRVTSLRVKSAFAPIKVTVNGVTVDYSRSNVAGSGTWHYCPVEMAVIVNALEQYTSHTLTITISTSSDFAAGAKKLDGMKGHIGHANLAKRSLDLTRQTVGAHNPASDYLKKLSSSGFALMYAASADDESAAFSKLVDSLPQLIADANKETSSMSTHSTLTSYREKDGPAAKLNPKRLAYALGLLNSVVASV